MTNEDIRELTIIGNTVSINGVEHVVESQIDSTINAIQYHRGRSLLEEMDTEMVEAPISKYQPFIDQWIAVQTELENFMIANQPTELELAKRLATNLIEFTIQKEINVYNEVNGISLSSVHNAESYSRVLTYTHKDFCLAVWLWSVELWEFMRAWQNTLTVIPTEQDILNKISEKPFVQ